MDGSLVLLTAGSAHPAALCRLRPGMPSRTCASASIRRDARASFARAASRRRPDAENFVRVISTAMRILHAAQGVNVWPAPSARASGSGPCSVCVNVSGLAVMPRPKWRSAQRRPHNHDGIEDHSFSPGSAAAVRLSGHLPFTTRRQNQPPERAASAAGPFLTSPPPQGRRGAFASAQPRRSAPASPPAPPRRRSCARARTGPAPIYQAACPAQGSPAALPGHRG